MAVKKMWIPPLILVVAAALVLAGCKATRAGYESATYRVVRSSGKFQVRDYPALTLVETSMAPTGNGADGGFNRLFRFITGANDTSKNRDDHARVHVRRRNECDHGFRDAGQAQDRGAAKAEGRATARARVDPSPLCRPALPRQAQRRQRGKVP